jgi:hypothetical protein
MSNRTELRTRLRHELGDTAAQVVWSDTLLDSTLIEAGAWYSRLWPRQATAYRDVAGGARTFSLPPGALGISGVECPPGNPLPQEASGPIGSPPPTGVRQTWSLWGDTLYLGRPASGHELGSSHLVLRLLLPWDRLDPVEPWNGPQEDERLLILWSAAQAYAWLEGQDAKRARNPAAAKSSAYYTAQLEREISARRRAATSRRLERA